MNSYFADNFVYWFAITEIAQLEVTQPSKSNCPVLSVAQLVKRSRAGIGFDNL
jgi:hypothetical protein